MDVICVFDDATSKPYCTEFHVRFRSPFVDETTVSVLGLNDVPNHGEDHPVFPIVDTKRLSDSATKAHLSGHTTHKNDHVQVSVNGKNCPDVKAFIGEEQFLYFYDVDSGQHSRTPSSAILSRFDLKMGKNTVTCIHFGSNLFKEFNIWRLHCADSLIVMDIDGTITKSDITGYIQTVYMGMFSHVHDGIVPFLNTLKERYNYTIVYLTARPLIHQKETRLLLEGIKDSSGRTMPDGPLFPSKDKLLAALYREVISKTTVKMKSGVLGEINRVFRRAGCGRITPFVLGVGNKENDAFAYNLAGLNAENILLIDKSSRIEVWKHKQLQQMHYNNEHSMHAHSAHGRTTTPLSIKSTAVTTNNTPHDITPNTHSTNNTNTSSTSTNNNTPHIHTNTTPPTSSTNTNSNNTSSGKLSPKLERGHSEGATIVKAVTPHGSAKFAVLRDDSTNITTSYNTTHSTNTTPYTTINTNNNTDRITIDTNFTTTSTGNNSAKSTNSSTTNTDVSYSEQRMYSTDTTTSPHTGNITITNNDYFGRDEGSGNYWENRSLSTTENRSLSTLAGCAEVNDFQACSLPAEKRSIWSFMQRKSPHTNTDNSSHACVNMHVFHTYNDDRLMDYVHKLCKK